MSRSHARDRHGRGLRGEIFSAPVPSARSRAARFDRLAARIMDRIRSRADGELDGVVLAVDRVPPPTGAVELGRVFPATPGRPATIVVHRLPIASRCADREELVNLLGRIIGEQAGLLCGRDAAELWPEARG